MNLDLIGFTPARIVKGLDVVRRMQSLKNVHTGAGKSLTADEFWKKYDAGEFSQPAAPAKEP
jgi:hypothetical protein